jgi:hypothetical protein
VKRLLRQVQAAIISQLCLIRSLLIIIAVIHPDHNGRSAKSFSLNLRSNGWVISSTDVFYTDLGNTIAGSCCLIIAIHSSCALMVTPLLLKWPPLVPIRPIGEFIWEPFNWPEHAILLACNDADFDKQDLQLKVSTHKLTTNKDSGIIIKYSIHQPDSDNTVIVGSEVISIDGLCPAFNACPNSNIFQTYFGLEFHYNGHSYIRAISSYKFICCFNFIDQLTYWLSQPPYKFCVDAAMPACTSEWLFEQVHAHLVYLQDANSELFSPHQFVLPAATIQAFVNGAIGIQLPSKDQWIKAYSNNTEMCTIRDLITNTFKNQ